MVKAGRKESGNRPGVDKWGKTVYARLGNVAFIGQALKPPTRRFLSWEDK